MRERNLTNEHSEFCEFSMTASSSSDSSNSNAQPEAGAGIKDPANGKVGTSGTETGRTDMPVSAVARLLGVATQSDLTLLDGKIDLLINKLNLMQVRVEKLVTSVGGMPTGADLERIDVQLGSLRAVVRDAMAAVVGEAKTPAKEPAKTVVAAPEAPSEG